jgi:hypothetical protein
MIYGPQISYLGPMAITITRPKAKKAARTGKKTKRGRPTRARGTKSAKTTTVVNR